MVKLLLAVYLVTVGSPRDLHIVYPRKGIGMVRSSGVNGVFYDTKTGRFASLLFIDGKWFNWYPDKRKKQIGGLLCRPDGTVLSGYFSLSPNNELLFNGQKVQQKDILWAMTGGGLYISNGKLIPTKEVKKREGWDDRILYHKHFSFLVIFKDGRIGLGVSVGGSSPEAVARQLLKQGAVHFLRLDGGSSTTYWKDRIPPKWMHHGFFIGVKMKTGEK